MDNIIKQFNCSALVPELLNSCYIYVMIGSKELLANLLRVFPYNKGLGTEVSNITKAT